MKLTLARRGNKLVVVSLLTAGSAAAQAVWFAGGGTGIATLSADARSVITTTSSAISQYKPENGPMLHLFAGRHVRDYFSVQGAWSWNRNQLGLLSSRIDNGRETLYDQERRSSMHNGAVDAMLYFRGRSSFVRPFLMVGLGMMSFESGNPVLRQTRGAPVVPPAEFSATKLAFRSAAGIDLILKRGWGIRYKFIETIQGNPISARLDPPGKRNLANFQNVFGVVKYF